MKKVGASVAQLMGALLSVALIVFGVALMGMKTGYGGAIVTCCGVLLLPRVFGKVTAKLSSSLKGIAAVLLVIIALFAGTALEGESRAKQSAADLYVAAVDERREAEQAKCDDPGLAYTMAQNFVRAKLVAPSTAEFPSISKAILQSEGGCKFKVQSFVDSQNSLGANLRQNFMAEVRYDRQSGKWLLENLIM